MIFNWKLHTRIAQTILCVSMVFIVLGATFLGFFLCGGQQNGDEKSILTALFFAVQTVTTTGYGSGFEPNDNVKVIGCLAMLAGATTWSLLMANLAGYFVVKDTQQLNQPS